MSRSRSSSCDSSSLGSRLASRHASDSRSGSESRNRSHSRSRKRSRTKKKKLRRSHRSPSREISLTFTSSRKRRKCRRKSVSPLQAIESKRSSKYEERKRDQSSTSVDSSESPDSSLAKNARRRKSRKHKSKKKKKGKSNRDSRDRLSSSEENRGRNSRGRKSHRKDSNRDHSKKEKYGEKEGSKKDKDGSRNKINFDSDREMDRDSSKRHRSRDKDSNKRHRSRDKYSNKRGRSRSGHRANNTNDKSKDINGIRGGRSRDRDSNKKDRDSSRNDQQSLKKDFKPFYEGDFKSRETSQVDIKPRLQDSEAQSKNVDRKIFSAFNDVSRKIEIKISSDLLKDRSSTVSSHSDNVDLMGKWEPVGKKTLKAFTDLCRTLAGDENGGDQNETAKGSVDVKPEQEEPVRHPFNVKPAPAIAQFHCPPIVPTNPAQAIQAGMISQILGNMEPHKTAAELPATFPVSSGLQHRAKESLLPASDTPVFEDNQQKVNISATILKRLNIQKALKENPFDIEAHKKLQECDENIKLWSKSGVKPEQFTGEKMNNILKREDLAGGYHAWVKKDFFTNLLPITDGIGMQMLQRMGWTQGTPLGRKREGYVNPITVEVRTARKGLCTAGEGVSSARSKNKVPDYQGKHPVSALTELCTKRKWMPADYKVIMDTGPAHNKKYLFMVTVNGNKFTPAQPSANKKTAKAQAAAAALAEIGISS